MFSLKFIVHLGLEVLWTFKSHLKNLTPLFTETLMDERIANLVPGAANADTPKWLCMSGGAHTVGCCTWQRQGTRVELSFGTNFQTHCQVFHSCNHAAFFSCLFVFTGATHTEFWTHTRRPMFTDFKVYIQVHWLTALVTLIMCVCVCVCVCV